MPQAFLRPAPLTLSALVLAMTSLLPAAAHADKPATAPLPPAIAAQAALDGAAIVGGSDVRRNAFRRNFRWMLSLQYQGFGHFCGASLIDRRWAMTASHCVEGTTPDVLSVLQGTRQLSLGGQRVAVEAIVVHPDYDPVTVDSDITLLRLAEPISAPRVDPATPAVTNQLASPGREMTIIGWGALSEGGDGPDILQRAEIPIVSQSACRDYYGNGDITDTMICAGTEAGGVDTCQGDSGGPMAVRDGSGDWHQIGITSFGYGCARPGVPGVYARVASFDAWIAQVRAGDSSACANPSWPGHFRMPAEFGCASLPQTDDGSLGPVPLGFRIRLGDQTYDSVYVNNNGNVTFGGAYDEYQPGPLSTVPQPIIAPYFDDASTERWGSVRYGQAMIGDQRAFIVVWDGVGGYNAGQNRNTFQLVLLQRNRRTVDIEFNYAGIDYNLQDAYVGFSVAQGGPSVELPGSGDPGSFVDGSGTALVSNTNAGVPGRFRWRVRNGQPRT